MNKMTKSGLLKTFKAIKKDVNGFVKQYDPSGIENTVKGLLKKAPQELSHLIDQDLPKLKKSLLKEKSHLEKSIDKLINQEIKKAKKFVATQKKEIDELQKRIEKLVANKAGVKKARAKKTAAKKATKKVGKKVTKKKATKASTTSSVAKKKTSKKKAGKKSSKKA